MSENLIDVSVLVVGDDLSWCLTPWFFHLEHQDYPMAHFEWIIVETNSSNETRKMVLSLSKGSPFIVRYVQQSGKSLVNAWNTGFREAQGKWVLCSKPEVLPASNWIQRHVQLQRTYENKACIGGAILVHPRLSPKSLTPLLLPEDSSPPIAQIKKITPYHFSLGNMSLPRNILLQGGVLNKTFYFPEFAETELVKRLSHAGCPLLIDDQAICWFWKGGSYLDMCKYHYRRGYSMGCYLRLLPDEYSIVVNYRLYPPFLERMINSILVPYYHRFCLKLIEDSQSYLWMYRRVFRYWRLRGFSDAMARREPQIDIIYT